MGRHRMTERDVERFSAVVRVLVFAAIVAGGFNAWLGIATGSRHAAMYAAVGSAFVFMSPWVLRRVRTGRVEEGLALVAIFFALGAVALAALQPQRDLVPIFMTLMGAIVVLVFGRTDRIRFYFASMWTAALLVVTLDVARFGPDGALTTVPGLGQVITAAIAMAVVLYLAYQHFARLDGALWESQEARAELAMANEELRGHEAARSRFLNTAAHELGTPLTPITIQVELLKRKGQKGLDAQAIHSVEVIDKNLRSLRRLVADLVEGLRTQTHQVRIDRAPFDLGSLLEEAVDDYRGAARSSGVTLTYASEGDAIVDGDPIRVRQVLDVLLTNALKFSPGGHVEVRVRADSGDPVVAVQDDGIGIDPRDIPRLFQPFEQVHDPMQVIAPGSGLGLFIARGIIERHGGQMWVDSAGRGTGTTVSFSLPRLHEGENDASAHHSDGSVTSAEAGRN